MNKFWQIKFKGRTYYLCSGNKREGAIATKHQYENGLESYAHLWDNPPHGEISRFGVEIGTRKDLKFIKKVELNPKAGAFSNLFSWMRGL